MKLILPYSCLYFLSMAFFSCNHEKEEAVTMEIIGNEFRKNNHLVTYHIDNEKNQDGVTTVYYKASCTKTDTGTMFLVFDSIKMWRSADGHYLGK